MANFNNETPAGPKIINISHLLSPEVQGLKTLPPDDFMAPHFNKKRGLGDGLYLFRIYSDDGEMHPFMNGVISEQNTGDPDDARERHQQQLKTELTRFYEVKARDTVKKSANVCTYRKGHMSFLAVKCKAGILAAGWYDAESESSTIGINTLAFTMYALGIANYDEDEVLRRSTINYLPNTKGLGDFDTKDVEAELAELILKFQ